MTSASTASESVPVRPGRPRSGWWVAAAVAVVLSLVVASNYQVPYFAISPGGALPVRSLIEVNDGPSYPPTGNVLLTTVSLGPTTVLEALQGWLDPETDVVERKLIVPPDTNRDEFRRRNLQEMATSKQAALGVAFEKLGYDAISGDGAAVVDVGEDQPASGLLRRGDVITAVDGQRVELGDTAVQLLGRRRPGDSVRLTVERKGAELSVDVVLGKRPGQPARPFLGVVLQTKSPRFDFPYDVDIASERIGGPSAGLAFTLGVLDVLTPGELTGGRTVATTGTIELDGRVGEVGGVAQKTIAVRRSGAELFLVPRSELAEARRHAGKLRVEGVETLDDALRVLASVGGSGVRPPGAAP